MSQSSHVVLCGALSAEIGGRRLEQHLPGRKGRQLFACLVIGRPAAIARDELIEILWPDDPPADPDGAFATQLTRLRAALGPGVVRGRCELTIDLGPDPWVDWEVAHDGLAAAEAAYAAGDDAAACAAAAAALEVARRPLLPGIASRWADERRRELLDACAALLEIAGKAALRRGGEQLPAAERHARELIDREPYRESAYELLMRVHEARGNFAEGSRVFDGLRQTLRDELGLTPGPSVTALAERLIARRSAPPAPAECPPDRGASPLPWALGAAAAAPLIGRERELRFLLEAIRTMWAGRCSVLAVTGPEGAGKTRLVAEAAMHLHDAGYEVVHGRAQREGVTPYQAFVEALRHHLAHSDAAARELAPMLGPELAVLARVVPELRAALPAVDSFPVFEPRAVFDAMAALWAEIARRRPLLIVLEDIQWADRRTLLLLRHVAHCTRGTRLTLALTLREAEPAHVSAVLGDLLRERALARVALAPQDDAEVGEDQLSRLLVRAS